MHAQCQANPFARRGCPQLLHGPHGSDEGGATGLWAGQSGDATNSTSCARGPGSPWAQSAGRIKGSVLLCTPHVKGGHGHWEEGAREKAKADSGTMYELCSFNGCKVKIWLARRFMAFFFTGGWAGAGGRVHAGQRFPGVKSLHEALESATEEHSRNAFLKILSKEKGPIIC